MSGLAEVVSRAEAEASGHARVVSRWPRHEEDEIAAVVDVLRSGRVNALQHGERVRAFEQAFARRCAMPHAIAMANGTVTLEIALRALGIGAGDEVIVTPRSFVASAASVVAVGARPVFADVDPMTQGLTVETVRDVLSARTRAIMPVHLGGWPSDVERLAAFAGAHGLKLIEDCAQAHGASLNGRPVGSFGDAASFSFCTDKIMSTGGEGGMLVLRDADVHARAWSLKDHGKRLEPKQPPGIAFRWIHDGFGTNARMTEMQAAIGLVQLGKLDGWLAARQANAMALAAALQDLAALRVPLPGPEVGHAWYKFGAFVRPQMLKPGATRNSLLAAARLEELPCASGTCPEIYRERSFVDAGLAPTRRFPVARLLGATSIMLPIDHTLGVDEVSDVGRRLAAIVRAASA